MNNTIWSHILSYSSPFISDELRSKWTEYMKVSQHCGMVRWMRELNFSSQHQLMAIIESDKIGNSFQGVTSLQTNTYIRFHFFHFQLLLLTNTVKGSAVFRTQKTLLSVLSLSLPPPFSLSPFLLPSFFFSLSKNRKTHWQEQQWKGKENLLQNKLVVLKHL